MAVELHGLLLQDPPPREFWILCRQFDLDDPQCRADLLKVLYLLPLLLQFHAPETGLVESLNDPGKATQGCDRHLANRLAVDVDEATAMAG